MSRELDLSAIYNFLSDIFTIRSSYKPSVVIKNGVKIVSKGCQVLLCLQFAICSFSSSSAFFFLIDEYRPPPPAGVHSYVLTRQRQHEVVQQLV